MASPLSPTASPAPSTPDASPISATRPAHAARKRRSRSAPAAAAAGGVGETGPISQAAKPEPRIAAVAQDTGATKKTAAATAGKATAAASGPRSLSGYIDGSGRERDLIGVPRKDGCVLVVDRDILTLGDRRLVACIAPDELPESTQAVCAIYMSDPRKACRRVQAEDLKGVSDACLGREGSEDTDGGRPSIELTKRGPDGRVYAYSLEPVGADELAMPDESPAQLRWCRRPRGAERRLRAPVSLREVVGELESYEPACEITSRACAAHRHDPHLSTAMVQGQLDRLRTSSIVLNRGLREAVLGVAGSRGLSMSEIAVRCGRIKGARKGMRGGETSWLARRLGLLPESGNGRVTPWVHSDVLGLIARDGLGVSPREVELS